jgi:hypothetical protein
MKKLNATVYPSTEETISVIGDDTYGGAHTYSAYNSLGFNNGKVEYTNEIQRIEFVKKLDNGDILPGLQSEQLLIILIDRHKKLNARFPSREGALAITKMEEALHWLEARVKDRINRDVMGDLKP